MSLTKKGASALAVLVLAVFSIIGVIFLLYFLRNDVDVAGQPKDGQLEEYEVANCQQLTRSRSYDSYWNCLALGPSAFMQTNRVKDRMDDLTLRSVHYQIIRKPGRRRAGNATRARRRRKVDNPSHGPYVPVHEDYKIEFEMVTHRRAKDPRHDLVNDRYIENLVEQWKFDKNNPNQSQPPWAYHGAYGPREWHQLDLTKFMVPLNPNLHANPAYRPLLAIFTDLWDEYKFLYDTNFINEVYEKLTDEEKHLLFLSLYPPLPASSEPSLPRVIQSVSGSPGKYEFHPEFQILVKNKQQDGFYSDLRFHVPPRPNLLTFLKTVHLLPPPLLKMIPYSGAVFEDAIQFILEKKDAGRWLTDDEQIRWTIWAQVAKLYAEYKKKSTVAPTPAPSDPSTGPVNPPDPVPASDPPPDPVPSPRSDDFEDDDPPTPDPPVDPPTQKPVDPEAEAVRDFMNDMIQDLSESKRKSSRYSLPMFPKPFPICADKEPSPLNIITKNAISTSVISYSFNRKAERHFQFEMHQTSDGTNLLYITLMEQDKLLRRAIEMTGGAIKGIPLAFERMYIKFGLDPDGGGSEHQIDGKSYAMELQLVFSIEGDATQQPYWFTLSRQLNDLFPFREQLVIILAVLVEVVPEMNEADHSQSELLFEPIIQAVHKYREQLENASKTDPLYRTVRSKDYVFRLPDFIPDGPFYTYRGSLTTPPCFSYVTWSVYEKPLKILARQFTELKLMKAPGRDDTDFFAGNIRTVDDPWVAQEHTKGITESEKDKLVQQRINRVVLKSHTFSVGDDEVVYDYYFDYGDATLLQARGFIVLLNLLLLLVLHI